MRNVNTSKLSTQIKNRKEKTENGEKTKAKQLRDLGPLVVVVADNRFGEAARGGTATPAACF